ncbi:MAG: LysE family translocator [Cyanobacteria bacterium P01_F01_bin.86]
MTVESILALFVAMLISAAVPGPGVFACIARAIASGFQDTLYVIAGILIGNIVFLVIAILGLVAAAQALGSFFIAVKYLGALYLVWLGLKLWLSDSASEEFVVNAPSSSPRSSFLTGLILPFSNSAVIFFYVSLLPTFINLSSLSFTDSVIAILVISVALFTVLALYSYSAAKVRKLFNRRETRRAFNRGAGTLMIGTGVYVAVQRA